MRIPVVYSRIYSDFFAVFRRGRYIGDVRKTPNGWMFRSCSLPVFESPPCQYRLQAVMCWPELEKEDSPSPSLLYS